MDDDDLRRKLTPDHPFGCKRLVFATDYLQTLTQPHVEVVSSPARALRARSLGDRRRHRTRRRRGAVRDRICRGGLPGPDRRRRRRAAASLRETWRDGAYAYLGMAVPGFPNFFMLYGPNTNVGSNSVIFMLEAQAHYIVRALKYMRRKRQVLRRGADRDTMADFIAKIDALDGGHGVADALQQLLPRRQRPGRHAVAAQRERVLEDDAPVQGRRTTPSTAGASSRAAANR